MKKFLPIILAFAITFTAVPAGLAKVGQESKKPEQQELRQPAKCLNAKTVKFNQEYRRLWTDHVVWTRDYVKSALAGLPDSDVVLARLMKNQEDLGNAIAPYYGVAAANTLTNLLKEHIAIAGKVVSAAAARNKTDFDKSNAEWYRNADQISAFLSKANPYIQNSEIKEMMYIHLKLLTDMFNARINKNWPADIIATDRGYVHILHMADFISRGISKQFPDRF